MFTGDGVSIAGWEQNGGDNLLQSTTVMTAADAKGGTLTIEGNFTITTLTNDGADIIDNHIQSSGAAVTTAQLNAGTTDTTQSNRARTYTNVNLAKGASFTYDEDYVTLENGITPKGRITVQAA